jgi:type II secretory pathway predicted ATPase ExeA
MYEQFFGLGEKPFSLTPNPKFVFQSEQYRTAEEALLYGVAQKEGFMLVTGAPGTGKTTLCRDLLEKLDPARYRVALIFNPFLNGVEMLQALLSEFGVKDTSAMSKKELLDALNAFLLDQLAHGRTCIAIFDEAQHLSTGFLEQIRVLSNLETDSEKLIQIVLVGQPELLELVRTPQMAQLDQRVSVRCSLSHLSRDETARYIDHRLNVAGAKGRVRFEPAGVRMLHQATGGVPRLINLTADRSLLAAYTEQTRTVTAQHVRQALIALRGEEGIDSSAAAGGKLLGAPTRRASWILGGVGAAVVLLVVAALAWWQLDGGAEVLAWRGAMSRSSRDAEQAYGSIARYHRDSRHREYALLRLAQLEIAKGDARQALRWLDVLHRDYPANAETPERQYWTARALLAGGDTTRACVVTSRVTPASAAVIGPEFSTMSKECVAFDARARADSASANGAIADTASVQTAGAPAKPDSAQ